MAEIDEGTVVCKYILTYFLPILRHFLHAPGATGRGILPVIVVWPDVSLDFHNVWKGGICYPSLVPSKRL